MIYIQQKQRTEENITQLTREPHEIQMCSLTSGIFMGLYGSDSDPLLIIAPDYQLLYYAKHFGRTHISTDLRRKFTTAKVKMIKTRQKIPSLSPNLKTKTQLNRKTPQTGGLWG